MPYIPCDWPIDGVFGPEAFVNHPGAIPQSASQQDWSETPSPYMEPLHQWAESQRSTMTAEQIRLVRDLRSFESPVCMEAAREIERQAEAISILQATANRLLAESVKREQAS